MTSYSGNLIKLRRASDDTEQDFGMVNGVLDVASIVTWLGDSTGYLSRVYDQSGNNNHAFQTNPGLQPDLAVGAIPPDYCRIEILNQNTYLELTTRLTNVKSAFVTLVHHSGYDTNYPPILGDSTTNDFSGDSGTKLFRAVAATKITAGQLFINGLLSDVNTATKPTSMSIVTVLTPSDTLTVGNIANDRISHARSWLGQFVDIALFSSDQTQNRAVIESGIASCYGITLA
jgi:hypothetical protein